MIYIKLNDSYLENNPRLKSIARSFILSIGDDRYPVPSVSRSLANHDDAIRTACPYQINLRPGQSFQIDNQVFQTLVKSAEAGGDTNLVTRLLYYINRGMVEVSQDGAAPMTATQVLAYVAP